jgi:hypothetical protein
VLCCLPYCLHLLFGFETVNNLRLSPVNESMMAGEIAAGSTRMENSLSFFFFVGIGIEFTRKIRS